MKIVSWNCSGALRRKFHQINKYDADIFVIQECENPAYVKDIDFLNWAENHLWIGDNKNKGLGIFARTTISLEKLNWTNSYNDHSVKYFLPCSVNGRFQLLGVWTHQNNSPTFGYIGQLWKYLDLNISKLNDALIVGDFNSNAIWDLWDRWWNHSDVVDMLRSKGLESAYHQYFEENQGNETQPTFYLQKNLNKPFHIDYMFGSSIFQKSFKIEVGSPSDWLKHSDHMPLFYQVGL